MPSSNNLPTAVAPPTINVPGISPTPEAAIVAPIPANIGKPDCPANSLTSAKLKPSSSIATSGPSFIPSFFLPCLVKINLPIISSL